MAYKPYKGKDKYHIRVHKRIRHPAIIVGEDNTNLFGYDTTSSDTKMNDRRYHRLHNSFNGKNENSYVYKKRMSDKKNAFSKPYNNSHLSHEDEEYIDYLERRRKK